MAQQHKLTKKDLKEPDSLQRFGGRMVAFLDANRALVFGIVGLVLALLVGSWLWTESEHRKWQEMEKLYFEMEKLQKRQQTEPDENVTSQMQALLKEFSDGPQKIRAQLLMAETFFEKSDYDSAIQEYTLVMQQARRNSLNYVLAQKGLAYAHEAKKDFQKAVEIYKSIIDSSSDFPLFYIHMGLVRCYEALNDPQNANLMLREMKNKFPSHPDLEKVDRKLRQLE
ncbi:hypothetical protein NITGR_710024 [Nitrospina gracilis 3/211]|uniref:Ancillary SecYEG translocon subunit/Cell division coordinator CpoB TPR domain-containing protein n=1 Tax=Nitrospina gracilis (strain 3/211) TaxID=1266370 RepID=M1Z0J5_NITG3|nr:MULTISPECIES: tetratricopeptide repeat protein [Nitrospina]MCF8724350.1 lipopolysaccharide biosynthesis regulator YciM [Nitrospina sp. Nb-3]CCQ91502.1 hypothetical protein NITGR_710024 [Nitrospina gracilis 3/211]